MSGAEAGVVHWWLVLLLTALSLRLSLTGASSLAKRSECESQWE